MNKPGTTKQFQTGLKGKYEYTLEEAEVEGIPMAIPPPPALSCGFCNSLIVPKGCRHPFEYKIWLWLTPECECPDAVQHRKTQEQKELESKEKREKLDRIEKILQNSKMKKKFKERTFDNFELELHTRRALAVSKRYADNFKKCLKKGNGVMYVGSVGTGKTHLASAIANQLMGEEYTVIILTMLDLLQEIKDSWKLGTEHQIAKLFSTCDLLIIDDLGKEKSSEWVLAELYKIINARYEDQKPVVITTNYPEEELIKRLTVSENCSTAEAIVSRLYEMCYTLIITGPDWRRKGDLM